MSAPYRLSIVCCAVLLAGSAPAQDKLYSNTFPLGDVRLLEGPFKRARDLNIQTLMKYDVDRLLAPYRKEAGLNAKAESFSNWSGLDGHIAGHYLSAMAMNVVATGAPECRQRMEYIISELKRCQDAHTANHPDWGIGYAGGVPKSGEMWSMLRTGDFTAYRAGWVPWYNLHKMYAGLRDAWVYGGNEDAKAIFLRFCDWGINITSVLTDAQMDSMLATEHGGMNEIFADAFHITGEPKYLTAALRFSHKELLTVLAVGNDNLDNKHANTQIPKAAGFQRIAELHGDPAYGRAAAFFWETVTQTRTLAFGGNSRKEHFPGPSAWRDYIDEVQGPESCNSHNMLRLTEHLFRVSPRAPYADYYERTLLNHILSTQHPLHGGYVYFTPVRPRHYRVYSAPNQAMWCCVGTGMENHGKYGQFIYTHRDDSLFLNLFIASELNWRERGITIRQETGFPEEEKTKVTMLGGSSRFTLMIRHPSWVAAGALRVVLNGDTLSSATEPSSYFPLERSWTSGDVVEIILPMRARLERLPHVPEYVAIMHGPVLLAAKTGIDSLSGLIADESRWGHIAAGPIVPLDTAPVIVGNDHSRIAEKLVRGEGKPLTFAAPELTIINPLANFELEPFYKIHDSRYVIYFATKTPRH